MLARALFQSAGSRPDRLLSHLAEQAGDVTKITAGTVRDWRALHAVYLKEMNGMNAAVLDPVTTLLVDWITAEKNPRGRFNEYCRAAGRGYALQRLLMEATARLLLDGQKPADITAVTERLLHGPQGHQWRGQLFFEVAAELVRRGAPIGVKKDGDDGVGEEAGAVGMDPSPDDDEEA